MKSQMWLITFLFLLLYMKTENTKAMLGSHKIWRKMQGKEIQRKSRRKEKVKVNKKID